MRWGFIAVVVLVCAAAAWFWDARDAVDDVEFVDAPSVDVMHDAPPPVIAVDASEGSEPAALTVDTAANIAAPTAAEAVSGPVGIVVDENDTPLEGATVSRVDTRAVIATTNAMGQFTLPASVEFGSELLFEFARHRQSYHRLTFEEHAGVAPLRITLVSGLVVSLRVVDADGRPVPDALVMWEAGENVQASNIYAPHHAVVAYLLRTSARSKSVLTRSDVDGYARLGGIVDDVGDVMIETAVNPPLVVTPVITAGADVDLGTVTLLPTRAFGGMVRNEYGEPVGDATITAVCGEMRRMRRATTDAFGRFEAVGIAEVCATLDVAVRHPDFDTFEVREASRDLPLDVQLRERVTAELALIDGATGLPIVGDVKAQTIMSPLDPRIMGLASGRWKLTPDAFGVVSIEKIDRRDADLELSCEGYRDVSLPLDREWSATVETIEFWPVGDIGVRVIDAVTGLGLADAHFAVAHVTRSDNGKSMRYHQVSAKAGLSEGDYLVNQEAFPSSSELVFSVNVEGYEGASLSLDVGDVLPPKHTFNLTPSTEAPR